MDDAAEHLYVSAADVMIAAAMESATGKKHMPKAIVIPLIKVLRLDVAVTLSLTAIQNYQGFEPTDGFASAVYCEGFPVIATINPSSPSGPASP